MSGVTNVMLNKAETASIEDKAYLEGIPMYMCLQGWLCNARGCKLLLLTTEDSRLYNQLY